MKEKGLRVVVSVEIKRKDLETMLGMMRNAHPLHILVRGDINDADLTEGLLSKKERELVAFERKPSFSAQIDADDIRKAIAKRIREGATPVGDPAFDEADAEDVLRKAVRIAEAREKREGKDGE